MEDKLRRYVETLFEGAAPTKKTVELKEEMIQNLGDKYNDLLSDGKTPEAAFNIAVAGIGDVTVLLRQLERDSISEPNMEIYEKAKERSAVLTAVAVMMYILSILPLIIISELGGPIFIGIPILIVMVAVATGLLIYNSMTKPKYPGLADNMVEEFQEWQYETKGRKQMRSAISTALWSLILVLYFIISFTTMAWHVTWIVFIVGGLMESLINIFYTARGRK